MRKENLEPTKEEIPMSYLSKWVKEEENDDEKKRPLWNVGNHWFKRNSKKKY